MLMEKKVESRTDRLKPSADSWNVLDGLCLIFRGGTPKQSKARNNYWRRNSLLFEMTFLHTLTRILVGNNTDRVAKQELRVDYQSLKLDTPTLAILNGPSY
jgi:hypothetical protein